MSTIPNPLLGSVLEMMKFDKHQTSNLATAAATGYSFKNGDTANMSNNNNTNSSNTNNSGLMESLLSPRMNPCMQTPSGMAPLPLGAQVFTIPAAMATFPNSDQIPVFINSLGQVVLANTGNILANSLASLATTLTSIQQMSSYNGTSTVNTPTNTEVCNGSVTSTTTTATATATNNNINNNGNIHNNTSNNISNNVLQAPQQNQMSHLGMSTTNGPMISSANSGILDHVMQQYQQLQMLRLAMLPPHPTGASWQQAQQQPPQLPCVLPVGMDPSGFPSMMGALQTISDPAALVFQMHNSTPTQLQAALTTAPANTDQTTPATAVAPTPIDYHRASPSVASTTSSRSVGNKINQLIDVSQDFILSQDDNSVKQRLQSYGMEESSSVSRSGEVSSSAAVGGGSAPAAATVDGVDLGQIREFARHFKVRRLSLGLTQTQVGQALTAAEGPAYSQSAICRFEKLDITPKSAQKIKPVLEKWIKESEDKYSTGYGANNDDGQSSDLSKKRKRRTSFTPQALELLNTYFEKKSHPTGTEMRSLAAELNYDREVIRVWFCNKRQALKNSVKRIKHHNPSAGSAVASATATATTTTVVTATATAALAASAVNDDEAILDVGDGACFSVVERESESEEPTQSMEEGDEELDLSLRPKFESSSPLNRQTVAVPEHRYLRELIPVAHPQNPDIRDLVSLTPDPL